MRQIESIAVARNQLWAQRLTLCEKLAEKSPDEDRAHAEYAHLTHINPRTGTISLEAAGYSGCGNEYYSLTGEQLTDPDFETATAAEIAQAEAELADEEGREEARSAAWAADFEAREHAQYLRLAAKYGAAEEERAGPADAAS